MGAGAGVGDPVQVMAVSSPDRPEWRWRIVDYNGQLVEESDLTFRTIAGALEEGGRRLAHMSEGARPGSWR